MAEILYINQFGGLSRMFDLTKTPLSQFFWIKNLIPLSGELRVPLFYEQKYSAAVNLKRIYKPRFTDYILVHGSDDAIYRIPDDFSSITKISGTVQFINPVFESWMDQQILIVDASAGYYRYNTTDGLVLIDSALTGDDIAVWQGRVYIAKGMSLAISAPLSFSDFSTASGGGLVIFPSNIGRKIMRLAPAISIMYVIGDRGISYITPPQYWATGNLIFDINWIAPYGVPNRDAAAVFVDTVVYFTHNKKCIAVSGSSIDDTGFKIRDFLKSVNPPVISDIVQIGDLTLFLMNALCADPVSGQTKQMIISYVFATESWTVIDYSKDINHLHFTSEKTLFTSGNSIYEAFSKTDRLDVQFINGGYFEDWASYKNLKRAGISYSTDDTISAIFESICEKPSSKSIVLYPSAFIEFVNNQGIAIDFQNNSGVSIQFSGESSAGFRYFYIEGMGKSIALKMTAQMMSNSRINALLYEYERGRDF